MLHIVDELHLPDWFKERLFDGDAMEETIIDNKLGNLIGVLNYDLESTKQKILLITCLTLGSNMKLKKKEINLKEN